MAYTLGKAVVAAPGRIASAQDVESMSREARLFAHLSNVAYREPVDRPAHQNQFDLDSELNTDRFVVYTRGWIRVKAVIVAFRGTSTLKDLLDDVKLAANTNVNRLKQLLSSEVDCISAVSKKYPGACIHVTGHSLGGSIAMFVTAHTGLISGGHIFNPGAGFKSEEILLGAVAVMFGVATGSVLSPLGVSVAAGALASRDELSHESYGVGKVRDLASRINTHHVIGDPLSMLFSLGNVCCYTPTQVNLHALSNFLDEDVPSTEGMFSCNPEKVKEELRTKGLRRRSDPMPAKQRGLDHCDRGTCARRNHSHSGAGGWMEVVAQVAAWDDMATPLVEQLRKQGADDDSWRSKLQLGSIVEVLERAAVGRREGSPKRQSWVQAEVVLLHNKAVTLKWLASNGGGEMLRRAARSSTEMRACLSSDAEEEHVAASTRLGCTSLIGSQLVDVAKLASSEALCKAGFIEPRPLVEEVLCDISLARWRLTLMVGSAAELLVKKEWVRAEVVIARDRVLTMKWIDSQDGAEALRRVAREAAELRPLAM